MDKRVLRILSGRGRYVEDIEFPNMAHCVFIGSPHGHARIRRINTERAKEAPGILTVITGEDLVKHVNPLPLLAELGVLGWEFRTPEVYPMAVDKVRYYGEPVAAIIAEHPRQAVEAGGLIEVDYEALPAVTDALSAMQKGSPLLYEEWGDNIQAHRIFHFGNVEEAFKEADRVIEVSWREGRASGFPIEPRGCVASYDPVGEVLNTWGSYQCPFRAQQSLSHVLRLPTHRVKVTATDIGGAFGNRINCSKHGVVALASLWTGRPVKWFESQREAICTGTHQRDVIWEGRVAFKNDGKVLGVKTKFIQDLGVEVSHRGYGGATLMAACCALPNAYPLRGLEIDAYGVVTNKSFYGAYRGYGKEKGIRFMERVMDHVARELNMKPEEIRLKNFLQPHMFPFKQISGYMLDSGNYPALLRKAVELGDLSSWRQKQAGLREEGKYIGLGVAFVVEPAGVTSRNVTSGLVQARVKITPDGVAEVYSDRTELGQGAEESHRIVVSNILGMKKDDVVVHPVTSDMIGIGPVSSRGSVFSLSAVAVAAKQMKTKVQGYASEFLKADPEEIVMEGGLIFSSGNPQEKMTYRELAERVYFRPGPRSLSKEMKKSHDFLPDVTATWFSPNTAENPESVYSTFCSSADVAVVEVDVDTGAPRVLKLTHVHDAGTIISKTLIDRQIHGAVTQGIGEALFEELVYDEKGKLLTDSYTNYLLPTALDAPNVVIAHMETPSPFTELGTKGMGEAPIIGSKSAVISAIEDALSPFNIKINQAPATLQRIRGLILDARRSAEAKES
jgi:carbon-monoxide dehydrogenase large subunit